MAWCISNFGREEMLQIASRSGWLQPITPADAEGPEA
jgi:hypothetical protein